MLDDTPLPATEVSSSVLIASCSQASYCNGKDQVGGGKSSITEVEKGLLTLIASDSPGIQVINLIVSVNKSDIICIGIFVHLDIITLPYFGELIYLIFW